MPNRTLPVNQAYGSAELSDEEGNKDDVLLENTGSQIYIGNSTKGSKGRILMDARRHQLTIAPTQSGKTNQLISNLLIYPGSVLVIDPKGEIADRTTEWRRKMGQKIHIIDPCNESKWRFGNPDPGDTMNPLSMVNPDSPNYADDLAYLGEALIKNTAKDPHWGNAARELVVGLTAYEIETRRKDANLGHVREVLTEPLEKLTEILIASRELPEGSLARRKLQRYADMDYKAENREFRSVWSTALTQLSFLDNKHIAKNLETSSLRIEEMFEECGQSIYLVLPLDKFQTCSRWLRLIISIFILAVVRNDKRLKYPIQFFLDEMGTIGRLSLLANAYGLMAGLQMRIWGFVQTLGQLKRDYPYDWEVLIGNCDFITFFNLLDQETVAYLVDLLGEETLRLFEAKVSDAELEKIILDQKVIVSPMIISPRKLMDTAGIRYLPENQGILIRRGKPIIFEKPAYYKDPILSLRARKHPHFS